MNFADCVKETTTATSAATITLLGASAGFQAFAAAFAVGATGIPVRVKDDAGNWENSDYTLTNATTLTRTAIASSSNGGAPVTFPAGVKEVFCTLHEGVMEHIVRDDATVASELGDPNVVSLFGKTAAGIRLFPLSVAGITGLQLPAATTMPTDACIPFINTDGTEGRITFANPQAQLGGSTPPADTTAPTFVSALVANASPAVIVVTFNETLGAFTPAASAFAVSGGKTVSSVARSGATVSLTVNSAYVNGDVITVQYTKPGTNPLQDAAGNQVASFGPSSVANNIAAAGDTTPPTASSAAVANATPTVVNITMSEAMDAAYVPAASAFTVGGHAVSTVAISGSAINLTVSAAFVNGEAARTVAYTQPGTNNARDAAGNLLANFTGLAITNNVAAQVNYTFTPYSSSGTPNAVKTSVLTSTGSLTDGYRYYNQTDTFLNAYWNVSPTPASMLGGWGTSPTVPPAEITALQNGSASKMNGMVPLTNAVAPAWFVHGTNLWALDGAAGPFYYWLKPVDGAAYCLNPSAPAYVVVG